MKKLLITLATSFITVSATAGLHDLDDNITVKATENNGKCVIFVRGDITTRLLPEIEKAMEYQYTVSCNEKIVNLDSRGGQGKVAMEVGKLIRANNYKTELSLGSQCSSACGFIFIAGVERAVEISRYSPRHSHYRPPPKFGIHSPAIMTGKAATKETCITAQENSNLVDPKFEKIQLNLYNYAIQMLGWDIGIAFSHIVFSVKCADMIFASPEGLVNTKIATSLVKAI
jgi:hypothetical protein